MIDFITSPFTCQEFRDLTFGEKIIAVGIVVMMYVFVMTELVLLAQVIWRMFR